MAQELTRALIQDLSCDPKDSKSTAYLQICRQAEEWYRKAESQIHPMFRDAIQVSAREILTNAPQSALHFDIDMISKVGEHLESAGLGARKEFSRFAVEVTEQYQSTLHSLLNLPEIDPSIMQVVSNVSDRIEVVAQDIETWGHVPESVRSFLGNMVEVTRVANGVTHVAEQVGVALSSLWTKTEAAVSRADVLNEKVKDLRNSLVMPAIKGQPDKVAAVEAEIKVVEGLLAQEASGIGKALENVRAGFQAVGMIAGLLGHSELANDVVAVGEAAVSIAGSIATVVAGSSLGGPAMPVLAIAGTVAVLVSHFLGKNRGPSTEEIILKQMDLLAKHLDRRFDRIEAMIQKGVEYLAEHIDRRVLALSEHIDERFERIEKALTYMCKEMLEGFSKLHEHAENHYTAILLKLDGLATSIDYLHKDMLVGMTTLYKQDYTNIRDAALTSIARSSIQDGQHRDYYRRIRKWIKEDSKEELLSGSEDGSTLVVGVRRGLGGVSSCINGFRMRAIQLTSGMPSPIYDVGRLVNLNVWSEGVRTLIAYFALTPKLYSLIKEDHPAAGIEPLILRDLGSIEEEGRRIHELMSAIQQNGGLFEKLIENYEEALREVLIFMYQQTITAHGQVEIPSASIEAALQRVSAIENCSSFMEHEIIRPRVDHPNVVALTFPAYQTAKQQSHETHLLYSAARIYADYINSVTTLDAKLCDPSYRKDRILAVLSHHAIAERNRAEGMMPRELPDRVLMEKYFSVHGRRELNAHLTSHPSFDALLDVLQQALDELTIFISFAFPRQFVGDPSLRVFLDTLWSKRMLLDYIAQDGTPKDFIAIAIHKALEPGRELDCFKAHILGRVRGATLSRELSLEAEEYTHPLIQEILKELSVFKHTSELALSTVVQPVNSGVVSLGSFSASASTVPEDAANIASLANIGGRR